MTAKQISNLIQFQEFKMPNGIEVRGTLKITRSTNITNASCRDFDECRRVAREHITEYILSKVGKQ